MLAVLTKNAWDFEMYYAYNESPQTIEEIDIPFSDFSNFSDHEESTSPSATTAEATTVDPCSPMNWTACDLGDFYTHKPVLSGRPSLPQPWGDKWPSSLR